MSAPGHPATMRVSFVTRQGKGVSALAHRTLSRKLHECVMCWMPIRRNEWYYRVASFNSHAVCAICATRSASPVFRAAGETT